MRWWVACLVVAAAFGASCRFRGAGVGDYRKGDPYETVRRGSASELTAFGSEEELHAFLAALARAEAERWDDAYDDDWFGKAPSPNADASSSKAKCDPISCADVGCGVHDDGCGGTLDCGPCEDAPLAAEPMAPSSPAASPEGERFHFSDDSVAGEASPDAESITNVQHAGVDEGGIVKLAGDYLVVLRRGRLFTVRVGDDDLTPVAAVDAFAPDVDPGGSWYDEMLIDDGTVVVIGYSYDRGGTEIGLFDLDDAGGLAHRSTYHLRSNDYYSSRNYASRLIGDRLVFYSPLFLTVDESDLYGSFPAFRQWSASDKGPGFRPTYAPSRVYRPLVASEQLTLHTVTTCELGGEPLACASTIVMGPAGRVFYVSPDAVYIWTSEWDRHEEVSRGLVYRMPLDGSAPTAVRAFGSPIDQFSFLEGDDGVLSVLVASEGQGEWMWGSEFASGQLALVRIELDRFSAAADPVPASAYRLLPRPGSSVFANRFVGDFILYGAEGGYGADEGVHGEVFAYRYRGANPEVYELPLAHGVERIEAMGDDAIVIGQADGDLHFRPVGLGVGAWLGQGFVRPDAAQGERRSHGFFYRADGPDEGVLGLPVRAGGTWEYDHLTEESAAVVFLRHRQLGLRDLGQLESSPAAGETMSDGCQASCVDWYGNARPIFVGDRIFALLGYELVEGRQGDRWIRERRRVTFAPKLPVAAR